MDMQMSLWNADFVYIARNKIVLFFSFCKVSAQACMCVQMSLSMYSHMEAKGLL